MANKKRLEKSNNRILAGVLGGVADYFGWEPTITRLVYVVVSVLSTAIPGIFIYIVAAIVMPEPTVTSSRRSGSTRRKRRDVTDDDSND